VKHIAGVLGVLGIVVSCGAEHCGRLLVICEDIVGDLIL